jgi:hypothetical protein
MMTKEQKLLKWVGRERAVPLRAVSTTGLEPAARRLMKKGRLRCGTGAYSMVWLCPHQVEKDLEACKTKKARRLIEERALEDIALGNPRSPSLAKALLGTYDGKPNSVGYYP